ncbi:MAG: hypothetical protein LBD49_01280, partial [Oscillospiraceae bacterium]|nr:hypothetical protein [Oscillospiraceae bacterium]
MKKIVVIAAAIIAVVLFAHFYRLAAIGEIGFEAAALTGEEWIANLRSDDPNPSAAIVRPIFLDASDMLYERAGNLYAGEGKSRISSDFPIFVNGATAIMNLTSAAKLINEDFERYDSYYGLLVSDGHSYNYDNMTQADADTFILARMKSNIFSNVQEMAIEGENGYAYIPLNSLIFHTPEAISYYAFEPSSDGESGEFVFHRVEGLGRNSMVYFESKYYNYYDYLTRLGLYAELGTARPTVPGEIIAGGDEEEPVPEEEEDGVIKGEVVPIIPSTPAPGEDGLGGVAPIEDVPEDEPEEEILIPDYESKPGDPADPPEEDPNKEVYREPAVRLAKMRVDYNNTAQSGYTAEGRLSVLDRGLKLTGEIKIYLLSASGTKLSEVKVALPDGRDKERVYLSVTFSGLSLGSSYRVYGEYTYIDREGASRLTRFSEQEFEVKMPDLPAPLPPSGAAPSAPSKPVPPGYVQPTVTASALTGKVYSLHGTIEIKDPAARMTNGVTFTIWDKDPGDQKSDAFPENGAKTVRRVYIYQTGEMILDPVTPGETYWVTAEFKYRGPEDTVLVNRSFFTKQEVSTLSREALAHVGIAAEAGALYPFQLELVNFGTSAPMSADEIYTAKYTKKVTTAFTKKDSSDKKSFDLSAAQKTNVLGGAPITYLSPAVFSSNTKYGYEVSFIDVFGTDISKYYDELKGDINTCKSPPQASISMTANSVANFTAKISILTPDKAPSQNYKVEILNAEGLALDTIIKRGDVAETHDTEHALVIPDDKTGFYAVDVPFTDTITFTNLPLNSALKLVVYADYNISDYKDGEGPKYHENQKIGEYSFVTAAISSLGNVTFNMSAFSLDLDGQGADMDIQINTQNTNELLRHLLTRVTLTFTPRGGGEPITRVLGEGSDENSNPDNIDFDLWKQGKTSDVWTEAAKPAAITAWTAGTSYTAGKYVSHGGAVYKAESEIAGDTQAPQDGGNWTLILPWKADATYGSNTEVTYGGSVYKAAGGAEVGKVPDNSVWHISLRGLKSATDYDIKYEAKIFLDQAYDATTSGNRLTFKTTRLLPKIVRLGEFVTSTTIDIRGLKIEDPDNTITGDVQWFVTETSDKKRVAGGQIKTNTEGENIAISGLGLDKTYEFTFMAPTYNEGFDSTTLKSSFELKNYDYNPGEGNIGPGEHVLIADPTPEEIINDNSDEKQQQHMRAAPFSVKTRAGLTGRVYLGGINVNGADSNNQPLYEAKFYVDLADERDQIEKDGEGKFYLRGIRYQTTNDGVAELPARGNGAEDVVWYDFSEALKDKSAAIGIQAYPATLAGYAGRFKYRIELYVVIDGFEKVLSRVEFDTDDVVKEIRDVEDFALIRYANYDVGYSNSNGTTEAQRKSGRYVVTRDITLDPINYDEADAYLTAEMRSAGKIASTVSVNAHGKPVSSVGDYRGDTLTYVIDSSDTAPFQGVIDFQGFSFTNNTRRGTLVWRAGAYAEIKNLTLNTSMFAYSAGVSDHARFAVYNEGTIHDIQINVGYDSAIGDNWTYSASDHSLKSADNSEVLVRYKANSAYAAGTTVYFAGNKYEAKAAVPAASSEKGFPFPADFAEYWTNLGDAPQHMAPETAAWNYYGGVIGRNNSGTFERFVIRVNQPVYARERFGFITSSNTGTISDGYVYAAPSMPRTYTMQSPTAGEDTSVKGDIPSNEQYAIQVSLNGTHQTDSTKSGYDVGGLVGNNGVNGVIENVYSTINILGVYDGDVHPDFTRFGTITGRNDGIVRGVYSTGVVAYRQAKTQYKATMSDTGVTAKMKWDGTWYTSDTDTGYAGAWYYPGVYYAIGPHVPTVGGDKPPAKPTLPDKATTVAYGPGVGSQGSKMKTSAYYYTPSGLSHKYTAAFNTSISVDMLRATSWQGLALGGGFDIAGTVGIGYYPHVTMDSSMPKQELMPLPFSSAEGDVIQVTSAVVEDQKDDYALVVVTLKNPKAQIIRDFTIKDGALQVAVLGVNGNKTHSGLAAIGKTGNSFGNYRQIDADGMTRVWIVLFSPKKPQEDWGSGGGKRRGNTVEARGAYMSQYTITEVWCAPNGAAGSVKVGDQNVTVNAEFYQPIATLLDWVRFVATDFAPSASTEWTKRNYRLTADIDFSEAALKALTADGSTTLERLKREMIFRLNSTGNNSDVNTVTTARGAVVTAGEIPEFRVGVYTDYTSSNHEFRGNLDGGKYNSQRELTGMYSLKNIKIDNQTGVTVGGGLFAFPAGRLTNFIVDNYTVEARSGRGIGLAQSMGGGYVDNVHVRHETLRFTNTASINETFTGGLIGYLRYGEVYNSSVGTLEINSASAFPRIGGLLGYTYFGRIENCYATDINITADNARGGLGIGGILGYGDQGIARNMYATGSIHTTDQYVGGVAGKLYVAQVLRNTWNMVNVMSISDRVGGIAGGYLNNGPTALNSVAWGSVASAWSEFNPADAAAYVHRCAGDGQYSTRRASVNVYAWDGQKINGVIPLDSAKKTIVDDVTGLLKVGSGDNPTDLTDLRNVNTYYNAIRLGDAFIYPLVSQDSDTKLLEQMPTLKNTNGVWWPEQDVIPYPGAGSATAKVVSYTGKLYNASDYEGANGVTWNGVDIYIEHTAGMKVTDVEIDHVTSRVIKAEIVSDFIASPGNAVSLVSVAVDGASKYFDLYDVVSATLTPTGGGESVKVTTDGKVAFGSEMFLEISSAKEWQEKMPTYGYDYQNIKITGDIKFNDLYDANGSNGELSAGEMPAYNLYINRLEGDNDATKRVISGFVSWNQVAQYSFDNVEALIEHFTENPDTLAVGVTVKVGIGDAASMHRCTAVSGSSYIGSTQVPGTWGVVGGDNTRTGAGNIGGSLVGIITAGIKNIEFRDFAFTTTGKGVGVVGNMKGEASNLKFKNITIRKSGNPEMVGCIGNLNGTAKESYLEDIYIEGYNYVGGFVGYARSSTIKNVEGEDLSILSFAGSLKTQGGQYIGGLLGYSASIDLIDCKAHDVFVYGRNCIGGMAGQAHSALPWGTAIMYGNDIQNAIVVSNANSVGDAHVGGLFGTGVVYEKDATSNDVVTAVGEPSGDKAKMTVSNPTGVTVIDHVLVIGGNRVGGMAGSPANQHTTRGVRVSNSRIFGAREVGGIIGRAESIRDNFVTDSVISTIYCASVGTEGDDIKGYVKWRNEFLTYWSDSGGANKSAYIKRFVGFESGGDIKTEQVETVAELVGYYTSGGNKLATAIPSDYNNYIGGISGAYTVIGCGVINSFVGSDASDYVGGILGRNEAYSSQNNYVISTKIRGRDLVGGFAGQLLYASGGSYLNTINADVKGRNAVGGITGDLNQNVAYYGSRTAFIRQSYFVGTVEATGITLGTTDAKYKVDTVWAGGLVGKRPDYDLNTGTYFSNVNLVAATITVPAGGNAAFLYHKAPGSAQTQLPGGDQYVYSDSKLVCGGTGTTATEFKASPLDGYYPLTHTAGNGESSDNTSMLVSAERLAAVDWWGKNFRSRRTTTVSWNHFVTGYITTDNDNGGKPSGYGQYVHYRTVNSAMNNGYMPYLTKAASSGSTTAYNYWLMINQQGWVEDGYDIKKINLYKKIETVNTSSGYFIGDASAKEGNYAGGILIPTGEVSVSGFAALSLELNAIKLPLPVPTVYGAGGASGLNVEFDREDPDVGFYAKFDDEVPFAQSVIDKRTFTLDYSFDKAVIIVVTDGERTEKYRFEPEALGRTVMLWGDNYYFTTGYGVREKDGRLLGGDFTNLRDGQGVLATGELYDVVTGKLLSAGPIQPGLREETSPIYSFSYDGFRLDVFRNYTVSRAPDGSETELPMPLAVKNGSLAILDAALPVQYDGLVFDSADGAEYLSFLEDSGRVSDTRSALALPSGFRNYGIVHMTNNLGSDLPYVLVRYDTGHALGFNYLTGEKLDLSVGNSDMSLLEFAKGYVANPNSAIGSLADGYLQMTELREVLTLQSLTDEMLALQGAGESGEADENGVGGAETGTGAGGGENEGGADGAGGADGVLTEGGTGAGSDGTGAGGGENPSGAGGTASGVASGAGFGGDEPAGDGQSAANGASDGGGGAKGNNEAQSGGEGAPTDGEAGDVSGET